jgi:hypothetical protein
VASLSAVRARWVDTGSRVQAEHVVRRIPILYAAVLAGALVACGGPNPATHFCEGYGSAVGKLYTAADSYSTAPAEFATVRDATLDDLSRLRTGAPNDELRQAFDSTHFAFTAFSDDAALADFLGRADFADDNVVRACAEYGVEVTPAAG